MLGGRESQFSFTCGLIIERCAKGKLLSLLVLTQRHRAWVCSLTLALLCHQLCWGQGGLPLKWYNRNLPAPADFQLISCAYGNGTFVAMGRDGRVLTSQNGAYWTQSKSLTGSFGNVAFGNGRFWALAETGVYAESSIYTSTNGIDWEKLGWSGYVPGSIMAAEGRVLALGYNASILTSENDGVTWHTTQPLGNGYAATIGNGLFVVAISAMSPEFATVYTSTNGIDWASTVPLAPLKRVVGLLWVNGTFVATVAWGEPTSTGAVMTSPDGLNWSPLIPIANEYPFGIAYGNGLFVVGNWCSTNLNQWQAMDFTAVTNRIDMGSVTYGAGTFLAVGGNVVLQSDYLETIPPTVGVQPKSTVVYEGERAFFAVAAFGTPPLNYQWRHDKEPITNATNATFALENARSADAGSYDVVVSNAGGSTTSLAAQLEVSWLSIAQFAGLRLSGEVGTTLRIEYVDSGASTNWLLLTNVLLSASPYIWIDYDSANYPRRFYRAARPQ